MEKKIEQFLLIFLAVLILLGLPFLSFTLGLTPFLKSELTFSKLKFVITFILLLSLLFYFFAFFLLKKFFIKDSIKTEKIIEVSKDISYLVSLFCTLMINFTNSVVSEEGRISSDYKNEIRSWTMRAMIIGSAAFALTIYQFIIYKKKE
ncbi:hypothetical protein [Candidatus Enterococcus ikei]|uniref:DUF4149 domain-containing protein n=1 Tax=Candidatus Enterococcus ikei TaxID=2815326 RepID=A0ABS3GZ62_9ENTE|nr:hypothetical protein [Enterococcus sp. DIV0869a]MBO0440539.1 hypothetical protein [Enterococcus sp. DIV0869a]